MQCLEAYQARKIIIYMAKKNLDHWKLIIDIFNKDLKKSYFAANNLLSCNITLDSSRNIFTINEKSHSIGWVEVGAEYQLQKTYVNNVIYALAKNLFMSNEDTKDNAIKKIIQEVVYESLKKQFNSQYDFIYLINTFLKEKFQKRTLQKFIDKITNSEIKTEEQKTASITNKFSKITKTLDDLLIDFYGKQDETKKIIDENINIIKDCSFSLFLQLLEEQDKTINQESNKNLPFILRKILEIDGTNNESTLNLVDSNLDIHYKYKSVDLDKIKMIFNLIRKISENIKEQHHTIKDEERRFIQDFSHSLKNKFKLILSAIKILKTYKIHNHFLEDIKTNPKKPNNTHKVILHLYNHQTFEFDMPIINLKKFGIYKDSFFSSANYLPVLEFHAIDIGINNIDETIIYNFFKFIETGEINQVNLKDFIHLHDLFDYFIFEKEIQQDILNNYLLKYIHSNESEFILNQIEKHLNIDYTTYSNHPLIFRELNPILDLTEFTHNLMALTKADKVRIDFPYFAVKLIY